MKNSIFLLITILIITGCNNDNKIVGTWERQGDGWHNINKGMRVKVSKNEKSMYGEITKAEWKYPGTFSEKEIKWRNIKETGKDQYEIEDLVKGYQTSDYRQSHLFVVNDTITINWFFAKDGEEGATQKWIRVKE